MHKGLQTLTAVSAAIIAVALCALVAQGWSRAATPELSTPYQAVALSNGQVYFGRVDKLGGDYIVLRDAFYIQSRKNPDTQQVANVLVKRGGEAHGPDRMIVDARHVVLIEPVGSESQIGKLIREQAAH